MKPQKKSKPIDLPSGKSSLKKFFLFISSAAIAAAAFWAWENSSDLRFSINEYIDNGEIKTLEARYTLEKVIALYENSLLSEENRSFQKTDSQFLPHALFNIKFSTSDKKTREGILLWSLVDGEIVLDCDRWETSHGFEDAINAHASREDFKILNALEKGKGKLSIDQLQKSLHVNEEQLLVWLEGTKAKHLVVQRGNDIFLHFQNPNLHICPQTKLTQNIVAKPYNYIQKVSKNYTVSQLEKIAHAAFGQDFTIRSKEIIYLPIYSLSVLNPDNSVRTFHVNAVNGAPIQPRYLALQSH